MILRRKRLYVVGVLSLTLTVLLSILLISQRGLLQEAAAYGYVGLLVVSFFGGATVLIPIPSLVFTFTLGSVLRPLYVGVVAGLGEALGGLTIYMAGITGRALLEGSASPFYDRIVDWIRHRGSLVLFVFSAIINPFYYPMSIAAGVLHFGLWRFFFITWAGKTIKSTAVAYLGFFGLRSILRLLGLDF
jgi:membrane protein YqaA with SNARE-associated domain